MNKRQEQRKKLVEAINNSLPQKKWYCEEFEEEYSIAIGGIYDSEYMNFVFDNIKSNKIKTLQKEWARIKRNKNGLRTD
jgi:hypothetical protein